MKCAAAFRREQHLHRHIDEFGALESGLTAALFGPVVSVVGGGSGRFLSFSALRMVAGTLKIGGLDKTLR